MKSKAAPISPNDEDIPKHNDIQKYFNTRPAIRETTKHRIPIIRSNVHLGI